MLLTMLKGCLFRDRYFSLNSLTESELFVDALFVEESNRSYRYKKLYPTTKIPASTSAKKGYDFDPKNSYRKPPMTLTSHDLYILHW